MSKDQRRAQTKKALLDKKLKTFIMSGGVASNTYIRESLKKMCESIGVEMHVPEKIYCTDNATMIGAAAFILYKKGIYSELDINAKSNVDL